MRYSFHSFDSKRIDEIIDFAKLHPFQTGLEESLMRRFLLQLTSSSDLVQELFEDGQRVAVAVLLDRIQNKGNNASLEVLGLHRKTGQEKALALIISRAQSQLPSHRIGLEVAFHDSQSFAHEVASRLSLKPYYETYDMMADLKSAPVMNPIYDLRESKSEEEETIYDLLKNSFHDNVDISIPDFDEWKLNRLSAKGYKTFLAEYEGRGVGFLNLIQTDGHVPEIRTVGVLPQYRGRGIGKALIVFTLAHLFENKQSHCRLTVALQNHNALNLYKNLGFRVVDHSFVYVWRRIE